MDCQAITLGEHLLDVRYNLTLQHNKGINLKLAVASIDGVSSRPESTFPSAAWWADPPVNSTDRHFQLKLNVAEQQLEGELLCDQAREFRYHVYQLVKYAVDEALLGMLVGI